MKSVPETHPCTDVPSPWKILSNWGPALLLPCIHPVLLKLRAEENMTCGTESCAWSVRQPVACPIYKQNYFYLGIDRIEFDNPATSGPLGAGLDWTNPAVRTNNFTWNINYLIKNGRCGCRCIDREIGSSGRLKALRLGSVRFWKQAPELLFMRALPEGGAVLGKKNDKVFAVI